MTPAMAKLLMCVCAGGTGALVAPVAHRAIHAIAPHRSHAAVHRVAAPAVAVPCEPVGGLAMAPPLGGPNLLSPLEAPGALAQPTGNAGAAGESFASFGGFGIGGAGPLSGGGGGGGGGGGAPGGGGSGGGGIVPLPGGSSAPEPQNWALMLTGFGSIGAVMRSARRAAA